MKALHDWRPAGPEPICGGRVGRLPTMTTLLQVHSYVAQKPKNDREAFRERCIHPSLTIKPAKKLRAGGRDHLHPGYFHVVGGLRYVRVHFCILGGHSRTSKLDLMADVPGQVRGRRYDPDRLRSLFEVRELVRARCSALSQTS